jgi:hypothetical protein
VLLKLGYDMRASYDDLLTAPLPEELARHLHELG